MLTASARAAPPRFVYDGDGGRVKVIGAQGSTTFLGQSFEVGPTGTTTKYVFAGAQRLAAKDSTGALRFYLGDHLGSSNVITDGTGNLVELAEYTPYGSVAVASSLPPGASSPFKFTGKRLDPTGLYFYEARYYDPSLGRFIQADTLVPAPGDPQALNRYSYVRNNPVNFVDPSGYGFFRKLFAFVAAVAVAIVATVGVTIVTENPYLGAAAGIAAGLFTYHLIAGTGGGQSAYAATLESNGPRGPPAISEVAGHLLDVRTGQIINDPVAYVKERGRQRLSILVNGINAGPQGAREQAAQLEGPLVVFYDPTAGLLADLSNRGMRKWLGPTEIDKQLKRILDQLAEAGVPVDITAFSGGPIAINRALGLGARLAPTSTVTFFSSAESEKQSNGLVTAAGGKLLFIPTNFLDPINIVQDPGLFNLKMYGGWIGFFRDLATGFRFTAHKLPVMDADK